MVIVPLDIPKHAKSLFQISREQWFVAVSQDGTQWNLPNKITDSRRERRENDQHDTFRLYKWLLTVNKLVYFGCCGNSVTMNMMLFLE